jgi:hypothetical protein
MTDQERIDQRIGPVLHAFTFVDAFTLIALLEQVFL